MNEVAVGSNRVAVTETSDIVPVLSKDSLTFWQLQSVDSL